MLFITTKEISTGHIYTSTHNTEADYNLTVAELANDPALLIISATY